MEMVGGNFAPKFKIISQEKNLMFDFLAFCKVRRVA